MLEIKVTKPKPLVLGIEKNNVIGGIQSDTITRIEIVKEYPQVQQLNVLYLLVEGD